MSPFDIFVVRTGRAAVVQVCGELDLSTAPRLDEQLVILADEGVVDVTVDLAGLDFMDCSGLRALVAGVQRFREQGGDLGLRSPRPSTRRVLKVLGLTNLFHLEALEFVDPSPDRRYATGR